jgi:hypothetical protein
VLLDGEAWRRRRTVSDRDVLPVEVLVDVMGWPAVARVWWPMWLLNRETAISQVVEAFELAKAKLDAFAARTRSQQPAPVEGTANHEQSSRGDGWIGETQQPRAADQASLIPSSGGGDIWAAGPALPDGAEASEPLIDEQAKAKEPAADSGPPADPDGPNPLIEYAHGSNRRGMAPLPTWSGGSQPPVDQADGDYLADRLEEIVRIEGPMHAELAYRRYLRASGGQRLGTVIKKSFNQAMARLIRSGRVQQLNDDIAGQLGKTVFAPGSPPVKVREIGDRGLEEVPRSEVAALMQQLLDDGEAVELEGIKRAVLKAYGRTSLTRAASAYLDECAHYEWTE